MSIFLRQHESTFNVGGDARFGAYNSLPPNTHQGIQGKNNPLAIHQVRLFQGKKSLSKPHQVVRILTRTQFP